MANASPTIEREQIDALNAVASAAKSSFSTAKSVVSIADSVDAFNVAQNERHIIANLIAELVAVRRPELRAALDRARYWLGKTKPVQIPFLIGRSAPSACEGALAMLDYLAALVAADLGFVDGPFVASDKLPADADKLAAMLNEHWRQRPLPVWLRFNENRPAPVAELEALAVKAWREHNYAGHDAAAEQVGDTNAATDLISFDDIRKLLGVDLKTVQNAVSEWRKKEGHSISDPCSYALMRPLLLDKWPKKAGLFPESWAELKGIIGARK